MAGAVTLRNTATRYNIISIFKILYLVCLLLNAPAPVFLCQWRRRIVRLFHKQKISCYICLFSDFLCNGRANRLPNNIIIVKNMV